MKFLDNLLDGREDQAYALLRIVTGFLFIWHGTQKLFNFPADFPYPLNPLMYAAGTIEMVGGALVMIGLFTRPAAFICSGTMAVAYWMVHGMNNFFPTRENCDGERRAWVLPPRCWPWCFSAWSSHLPAQAP